MLADLIELYYSPAILNDESNYQNIKNTIDNIKIDNLLNINQDILNKFFIIVTENSNKIKTTLDPILEQYVSEDYDNDTFSNISHLFQIITPEIISNIINQGNSNIFEQDSNNEMLITYNDNESYDENDESQDVNDSQDEIQDENYELSDQSEGPEEYSDSEISENSEGDDLLDSELYKSNIIYDLSTHKYIQLHIFQKKFISKRNVWTKSKVKYLVSLSFNDELKINNIYNNLQNTNLSTEDLKKMEATLCDIDFYYKSNYHYYDDLSNIYSYLNKYDLFNANLYNKIKNISSGLYFNKDDILWQIFLCKIIVSTETFNTKYIDRSHYTEYKYLNVVLAYFPNFKPENASFYENAIIKDHNIICDKCQQLIKGDKFYNNHNFGDLCEKCFNDKKEQWKNRVKYLWNLVLLQGKKMMFQKTLEEIKIILNNKKLKKYPKKKYYQLLENSNKALLDRVCDVKKTCHICLDRMTDDIVVGSLCGHCFHAKCIEIMGKNQCPYCRTDTNFIKIFF